MCIIICIVLFTKTQFYRSVDRRKTHFKSVNNTSIQNYKYFCCIHPSQTQRFCICMAYVIHVLSAEHKGLKNKSQQLLIFIAWDVQMNSSYLL